MHRFPCTRLLVVEPFVEPKHCRASVRAEWIEAQPRCEPKSCMIQRLTGVFAQTTHFETVALRRQWLPWPCRRLALVPGKIRWELAGLRTLSARSKRCCVARITWFDRRPPACAQTSTCRICASLPRARPAAQPYLALDVAPAARGIQGHALHARDPATHLVPQVIELREMMLWRLRSRLCRVTLLQNSVGVCRPESAAETLIRGALRCDPSTLA